MDIKKKDKSNLFENFVSLFLIQGLNYVLPLITIPFLSNRLGLENYGLINFLFAFIQYFLIITDFGFGLSGTRYVAAHRDEKEKICRYLNSVCFSKLFLALISFFIIVGFVFFLPSLSGQAFFTFLFFGQVIGNAINPVWFFQGMEKMKYNTILHVLTRAISILPLFVLVKTPHDYIYIPICYSLGSIIAGALSLKLIKKYFGIQYYFTSFREVYEVTCDSSKYFLSRISTSLLTNTNTFVIGIISGNYVVGIYSLADKIYGALKSAYSPANGAIFPYMTKTKNILLFKKILYLGVLSNGILLVVFYYIFPYICHFFFGDFSEESRKVLNILLIAAFFDFPATFIGYPFLAALGHPNFCNYSIIVTSLLHGFSLFLLCLLGFLNVYTVAFLVVLSELFILVYRIIGIVKYGLWN